MSKKGLALVWFVFVLMKAACDSEEENAFNWRNRFEITPKAQSVSDRFLC